MKISVVSFSGKPLRLEFDGFGSIRKSGMSFHQRWSGGSFLVYKVLPLPAASINIPDPFGYRPTPFHFTSKHFKASTFVFFGISKSRSWASNLSMLFPARSAHVSFVGIRFSNKIPERFQKQTPSLCVFQNMLGAAGKCLFLKFPSGGVFSFGLGSKTPHLPMFPTVGSNEPVPEPQIARNSRSSPPWSRRMLEKEMLELAPEPQTVRDGRSRLPRSHRMLDGYRSKRPRTR